MKPTEAGAAWSASTRGNARDSEVRGKESYVALAYSSTRSRVKSYEVIAALLPENLPSQPQRTSQTRAL